MKPEILSLETVYEGWSTLRIARVRLADGAEADRVLEDHGQGVAVLPYDEARRVGLTIRIFRVPVLLGGGPISFREALAGIIEDEGPEETARREAMEEAGVRLTRLEPAGHAWTTPGLSTERIRLYLAPYAEGDRVQRGGGAPGEHENITVEERPLADHGAKTEAGDKQDKKNLLQI